MKVAAIVPVYNVAKFLQRCIASLLNQTHPFCEIVLVDDGSTDGSSLICEELSRKYSIVQVIHKENEGLGFARNTGMSSLKSNADYVMFIDSDDWLEKTTVEQLVFIADSHQADCVLTGFTKKNNEETTEYQVSLDNSVFISEGIKGELAPRLFGSLPQGNDAIPMSACGTLYRTSIIKEKGITFPSEREFVSEDLVFNILFLLNSDRVCLSDCTGYCYRTNNSSLTTSYREDRFESCLVFYDAMIELIEKKCLSKECIIRLKKSFFIYLRMCIKQEASQISGRGKKDARIRIGEMMATGKVVEIIESYPVRLLGFKQKVFLRLIKWRAARTMQLLVERKVF